MTALKPHSSGPRVPTSLLTLAIALVVAARSARADTAAAPSAMTEAEHVVPTQGGAFDVPLHPGAVCILSFPDKLASKALTSSPDYDIRGWGDDGVAVRATEGASKPATLALTTVSGSVKVNLTLRVVPADQTALTVVRFKSASSEEANRAMIEAAVTARTQALTDELTRTRGEVDERIRDGADRVIAQRLLQRLETRGQRGHARNDDHVIVHLQRTVVVGDAAYLLFELENRGRAAYRIGSIEVTGPDGVSHAGPAALAGSSGEAAGEVGSVAAGARTAGVVVIREVDDLDATALTLSITRADGRASITLDGIVLR